MSRQPSGKNQSVLEHLLMALLNTVLCNLDNTALHQSINWSTKNFRCQKIINTLYGISCCEETRHVSVSDLFTVQLQPASLCSVAGIRYIGRLS
jgi:hypothetical protein